MRLAEFILNDLEGILQDWEDFAHTVAPARQMPSKQLRNHAEAMLRAIAVDIEQPQSESQEKAKAEGHSDAAYEGSAPDSAAQEHASIRLEEGFSLPELVSEYRALRASVTRRWRGSGDLPDDAIAQLVRFNEAIDQSLAESVERFSGKLNRARELFMGALGHDLRGPLHVVLRGATYLKDTNLPDTKRAEMGNFVIESAEHMRRLIEDLVDVARTKLGGTLPIELRPMDAADVCTRAIGEHRAQNPDRLFEITLQEDLRGVWDSGRVEQVLSNLLGNAVQHGDPSKPITLRAEGNADWLIVRIHNFGEPIPEKIIHRIFEPMVQGDEREHGKALSAHAGLGLYIACTIVQAHGGSIRVHSSHAEGTTFEVCLPKHPQTTSQS